MGVRGERPEIGELAVEATQALARLDAARLEELVLWCQTLGREAPGSGWQDPARMEEEARQAAGAMAAFALVIEATRGNLTVMQSLWDLRQGRVEYSEAQALGWRGLEGRHGDN